MFVYRFLQSLLVSALLISSCYAQLRNKETASDTLQDKQQIISTNPAITTYRNKFSIDKRILRTSEISDLLAKGDTIAFRLYQKGRANQKTGIILAASGGGLLVVSSIAALGHTLNNLTTSSYSSENNESTAAIVLLVAGSGLAIAGIISAILGGEDKIKAVKQYNLTVKSKRQSLGFYLKPRLTGVSLGLRF